jgi:Sigma-70 region 2
LAERLSLWDIDDCVAFVATIVNRSGLELSWSDREDLEQNLLVVAWEISLKFEAGRGVKFSTYAGNTLRRRVVDWQRGKLGRSKWQFRKPDGSIRTYERQPPSFVSIDDQFDADSLGNALAASRGDVEADRLENGGGLFGDRDQRRARDLEALGHSEA